MYDLEMNSIKSEINLDFTEQYTPIPATVTLDAQIDSTVLGEVVEYYSSNGYYPVMYYVPISQAFYEYGNGMGWNGETIVTSGGASSPLLYWGTAENNEYYVMIIADLNDELWPLLYTDGELNFDDDTILTPYTPTE